MKKEKLLSFHSSFIPFKSKEPEHAVLFLVEDVRACMDAPESHMLPATDRELVEERDAVAALDGGEEGAIAGAQGLIAAPSLPRVIDDIGGFCLTIRIAGVDPPEVREQGDETTPALVDAVLYAMREIDFRPRENLIRCGLR
jgi:hypothetical protein